MYYYQDFSGLVMIFLQPKTNNQIIPMPILFLLSFFISAKTKPTAGIIAKYEKEMMPGC